MINSFYNRNLRPHKNDTISHRSATESGISDDISLSPTPETRFFANRVSEISVEAIATPIIEIISGHFFG